MTQFTIPAVPGELHWQVKPVAWTLDERGVLSITAGRETDMFHDPAGEPPKDNAACALFTPDALFKLSARVAVDFVSTYDAGALMLWSDADHWGKLCFEYSPQGQPMVVSVVTNRWSDDCNSVILPRRDVYLRVARQGEAFAFHYSEDGRLWHLVRHFTLHEKGELQAGFVSQSPTGAACTATFSEITYDPSPVEGIRSGA